eukprot:CAMPEP_0203718092 /NCGR_PEP_ID=MMETSP0092-20131115/2460_1 /ASSEMBLY_ACC=CAM_ASM_001090 /TAXON_ID=426623 /ORGANISM="Chaetoceros affinis, Strain CCMP159" /LENGTH=39 /DNA_ID= /DNA_START= /DNA_END= /DNA_ORIENTATION=
MIVPNIAALCPMEDKDENGFATLKVPELASAIAPGEPGA